MSANSHDAAVLQSMMTSLLNLRRGGCATLGAALLPQLATTAAELRSMALAAADLRKRRA